MEIKFGIDKISITFDLMKKIQISAKIDPDVLTWVDSKGKRNRVINDTLAHAKKEDEVKPFTSKKEYK